MTSSQESLSSSHPCLPSHQPSSKPLWRLFPKKTLSSQDFTKVDQCTARSVVSPPIQITARAGLLRTDTINHDVTLCAEAMGFRRITYYPDRPDNMAVFERIRIEADKENYPVLLSNGNLVEQGDVNGDRHYAIWSDPFPKPSYLFCAVIGNLGSIQDSFTTMSGCKVHLEIFSERENVNKLDYAMESLKRSMEWDEQTYGLEYDLDLYNIVAVNDFNMVSVE